MWADLVARTGPAAAAAGLACLVAAGPVAAQVEVSSGAAEIEIGGRLQVQSRTSSCSAFPIAEGSACEEDVPGLDWFIRRARISAEVRYNDWIEGKIQPDFGEVDGVVLKDAWGRLTLNPHARVTVGHFKRPFDGFELTSSTQILTIERDIDVPGVPGLAAGSLDELTTSFNLSDRDIGIMVDGGTSDGRFHYWVGAFNGRGPEENEDLDTEKQFVGRGQVSLGVGSLPLDLAAAAAFTDVPFTRESGELGGEYFTGFELWAELGDFDGGPHAQAGLVLGENPLQDETGGIPDLAADPAFAGALAWQVIGAWKLPVRENFWVEAVEPVFRVTMADRNTDLEADRAWGFTPGVQIFFDGRNKLALNWDFADLGADDLRAENSFKAQYQFHF